MNQQGVFIGKDAELVRTNLYEIIMRRKDTDVYLEAALSKINQGGDRELLALCQMDRSARVIRHAMIHEHRNGCGEVSSLIVGNDQNLIAKLGKEYVYTEKDNGNGIVISFENNEMYELTLAEPLESLEFYEKPMIREHSVEKCLLEWIKGTYSEGKNEGFWYGVTINTNKHMFIYTITPELVYIRAARFACLDKGVVFAQNIRMFDSDGKYRKAFMLEDNSIATEELVVDGSKFNPDKCSTPESFEHGIYWSLKDVNEKDDIIVLNGCEGVDYEFRREQPNLVETFA